MPASRTTRTPTSRSRSGATTAWSGPRSSGSAGPTGRLRSGAGDGIERRRAEARERLQPDEAGLWECYQRRWPEHAAAARAVFAQVERGLQELRERFQRLVHGRYWETAAPMHAQGYADSLPARYRRRSLEAADRARGSLRSRLSRDPERHADDVLRRELGPQAQRLDGEMRQDMRRHRPQWEVLQRLDTMRGEELSAEQARRDREVWKAEQRRWREHDQGRQRTRGPDRGIDFSR